MPHLPHSTGLSTSRGPASVPSPAVEGSCRSAREDVVVLPDAGASRRSLNRRVVVLSRIFPALGHRLELLKAFAQVVPVPFYEAIDASRGVCKMPLEHQLVKARTRTAA